MTSRLLKTLVCAAWVLAGLCPVSAAESTGAGSAPGGAVVTSPGTPQAGPGKPLDDAAIQNLLRIAEPEEVSVRLVMLPVAVEDKKGRIVRGLKAEDFRLTDEHIPQKIEYFSIEGSEPVSIAFLLDVSGSMRQVGKLEAAKEAIRFFVDGLRPQDRFALICFADEQVAWITDFTSDREDFLQRLNVQEGFGQTALRDAVAATPSLVDEKIAGRKAIILITDGVDNASRLTVNEAVDLARRVEVPIYTLGFRTLSELDQSRKGASEGAEVLRRFSDETGGALFSIHDPDDLKEAIARVNTELRFQYLIGYQPSIKQWQWNGTFREVRLETRRSSFSVRTRKGYYAMP